MSNDFSAADQADLTAAIQAINQAVTADPAGTAFTIDLAPSSGTLSLDANLPAIQLGYGNTLTILGNGATLDGSGTARGFYVYSGNVVIADLTIADAVTTGGTRGSGLEGGGGGRYGHVA